ncbi:MAG TPA: hypothetical protein VH370_15740 [Humisphaera sp.]|nr:hypothetical protein [Humisphaera sp.]
MTASTLQTLGLKPATLRAVERNAKRSGKTMPQYVRHLIERGVLADQSFDQILRPIREDVKKKGLTEEQVDQIVARARKATRPRRQKARP